MISEIAVPRSGSRRIRPAIAPTTMAIGSSEYEISSMRCMRRSSVSAVKRMAAILAISDGWMPRPPMLNQRRAPLIGALKSTRTSSTQTAPVSDQMNASFL